MANGWTLGDEAMSIVEHLRFNYSNSKVPYEERNAPLYDDENLSNLVRLSEIDPLEYIRVVKDIDKITGLGITAIKSQVDKRSAELQEQRKYAEDHTEGEESEFDKKVQSEVKNIIENGDTYNYIYKVWQKRVKGNALLGKSLVISRGVQSCINTKGLHIYAHGNYGQGKSHGMDVMASLLLDEFIKDSDVSPKVLYYMQGAGLLRSTSTFLIDDVDINNPLAGLFKKITTKFQKGAGHTVVMDGEVLELKLPPRINIWTNSVEFQGDEQSRDRFIDFPIDDNQTREIIDHMKQADQNPLDQDELKFETAVCKQLYGHLAIKEFCVEIPFAGKIEFPASENTRGYAIFSDLIKGLAILRYYSRKTNENGHLLANLDDFKEAKSLYEGLSGHSEQKYTPTERKVLKAIIDCGHSASIDQLHKVTQL